jgi:hypothetical protein
MILAGNIVELELDFHGDGLAGPPSRDWPPVTAFLAIGERAIVVAGVHHEDDR